MVILPYSKTVESSISIIKPEKVTAKKVEVDLIKSTRS